jgi:hypothetical protein
MGSVDRAGERIERVSLIDWICVRASHRSVAPADPSGPLSIHDDGRWAFCPAGLAEDADHVWFATGGMTRKALTRFRWPSEDEVSSS